MTNATKALMLAMAVMLTACAGASRSIRLNSADAARQEGFYNTAKQVLAANGYVYKESSGQAFERVTKTIPPAISPGGAIIPPKTYETLELEPTKTTKAERFKIADKCMNSYNRERFEATNSSIWFEFDCKNKQYVNITAGGLGSNEAATNKMFDKLEIELKTRFSDLTIKNDK